MTTIRIPATFEGRRAALTDRGRLLTATEWERAALVATDVRLDARGGDRRSPEAINGRNAIDLLSPELYADLGIVGLRSHHTVLVYARAWLDRFPRPEPGEQIETPDLDWPPTTGEDSWYSGIDDKEAIKAQADEDGTGKAKALDIAKNTKAMGAAIKGSLKVAEAAATALVEGEAVAELDLDVFIGLSKAVDDRRGTAAPAPRRLSDRNKSDEEMEDEAYWRKVNEALKLLLDVKVRISHGLQPPPATAILLEILVPETDWDEALRAEIGNLS